MRALEWRAIAPKDCDTWAKLLAAIEQHDNNGENYDADDLAEELADPNLDAAKDTVAVWTDGELVGYGMVRGASGVLDGTYRIHLEGAVAPEHRRQGIGRQLMDRLRARAATMHAERHPEAAGVMDIRGATTNASQQALAEREGFAPIRWYFTMARDLFDLPPVQVPDGLRLVPFDRAHSEATRLAHNEAFADHWGFTPKDAADWEHWAVGQRAFRPEVSFLLLDGTQVAGYLLSYEYDADTAVTGVREGYVGVLGTRRPWRGRGGGRALLAQAVRAYAGAGYQRSSLDVDADNPTGALGLYQRVGYAVRHESVSYRRPLPSRPVG